jgi:hypothetical protein
MSLKNIKDVLNRDEMKEIMAGSGGGSCGVCQVRSGNSTYTFGCSFDGGFNCICSGNNDFC